MDNSHLFEHEYGIIRKTNLISPRKIPVIDQAIRDGKKVVFCNSIYRIPKDKIIFAGDPHGLGKRGRIKYKNNIFQYAYIAE